EGASRHEIVANVRAGNTRSLTSLAPAAPRALESICRKAMELEPANRYATAVELAADIDRWMSDEAVLAHCQRETILERAGRILRQYRTWTVSVAAALLAMTAIAFIAILLISHAKRNEQVAKIEAQESKHEAVTRFRDARRAIDTWLVQSSDALEFFPETQSVRRRLLQLATEDYERLAQHQSHDADLMLERGRVLVRLGDLWQFQREFVAARSNYKSALDLFGTKVDDQDVARVFAAERANVHTQVGLALAAEERVQDARREFEIAIGQLTTMADRSHDLLARRYLASAYINQADVLETHGEFERAIESLSQGRRQYEMLGAAANSDTHLALARARELSGRIYSKTGRHEQAMIDLNEAIDGLLILVADQPDHPEYLDALASVYVSLANSFRNRGLKDQTLDALRSAVKHYRQLSRSVPDALRYTEYLGITLTDLGLVQHEAAYNQEAETHLDEAFETLFELADRYPTNLRCRENLATCQDAMGQVWLDRNPDPQQASKALLDARESCKVLIREHPERLDYFERFAVAASHYARALHRENKNDDARKYFEEAISILQPLVDRFENSEEIDNDATSYSNALANVHYFYALMLSDQQAEARQHFERALGTWMRVGDKQTARDKHHLAWLLATCPVKPVRDVNSSLKYAREATSLAPDNARFVTTHALASVLARDADEAFRLLDRAKLVRGEWIDRDFFVLAMALHLSGQPDQAKESMARGVAWMNQHQPFNADIRLLRETADSFLATEAN
ncbi:MAG: hypothetical protein ACR2NM_14520, partial [Bythopirellula sp.]